MTHDIIFFSFLIVWTIALITILFLLDISRVEKRVLVMAVILGIAGTAWLSASFIYR